VTGRRTRGRAELGLADTSVFIALEQERALSGSPPRAVAVSVITVGEVRLGVLAAGDGPTRARRLETCPGPRPSNRSPWIEPSLTPGRRSVSPCATRAGGWH
jgi:hypothetical protein